MAALIRIFADSNTPLVVTVAGDNKPTHTVNLAPGGAEVGVPMANGDFITIAEQALTPPKTAAIAEPPDVPTLTQLFTDPGK